MNDEQRSTSGEQTAHDMGDEWEEVGRQFRSLGESLAAAFRAAWHDENNQRRMREAQAGLEAMAKSVEEAVKESAESDEGRRVRGEVGRAADSLRNVGEQTAKEVAPYLLSALRQINSELQRTLEHADERRTRTEPEARSKVVDLPQVDEEEKG